MLDTLSSRELRGGEILFNEGDAGDCGYIIESGSIGLYTHEGGEKTLRGMHYAGDFLGELSLIGQRIRTTTAVAREPCRVLIVRRQDIDKCLADSDTLLKEFVIAVLGDLRNMLLSNWDISKTSAAGIAAAERELQEVRSMMHALEHEEFTLYYQPIMRLSDMKVAGFESLIRWNRPDYGLVSPAEFIPLAESSGVIVEIGRWVIQQACADLSRLKPPADNASGAVLFASVNLSGRQLSDHDLASIVESAIHNHELGPSQLKIEVTETELAENIKAANELLLQFKLLGVTVALDDFGTGQSSLEYLHQFPADTLKMDRSFIKSIQEDQTAMTIVSNIARLARELDMDVVAEGVELQVQADKLRQVGVDYAQGYLFARPLPFEELQQFIDKHGRVD